MRYLNKEQLISNISLGKSVEQWLSHEKGNYTVLRWLRINKEGSSNYTVNFTECFDDGDEDFIDIYDFEPVDPDVFFISNSFDSVDSALEYVQRKYSGSLERFVTAGIIQEEYKDYLKIR